MGRSVSTHRYAAATAYIQASFAQDHIDYSELPDDQQPDYYEFSDLIDDVREVVCERYPSFDNCDRWAGREDHVVLENKRAEVSISEYNGIVAICLAPRDPDNALDQGWADQVASYFEKHIQKRYSKSLTSQGRFSNGEQVFAVVGEPGSCVTSKEGRLW